jgi:hypothetical protein
LCDPAADDRALEIGIDVGAVQLATRAKMLPLFAHRALRGAAGADAQVRQLVTEALQQAEHRSLLQRTAALEMTTALARAGIATAALNGTALNGRLYPYPTRPGTDVDLLITPDAIPDALDVLDQLGYREPARTDTARRRPTNDTVLPFLIVDLADHLDHTDDPDQIRAALAHSITHPEEPALPTLTGPDELAHALARAAARPRWLTYTDALRLALTALPHLDPLELPEPARTGWMCISEYWPQLIQRRSAATP